MRKFFVCLIAIVAVGFWSLSASATSLIYDPFDYTSGADLAGLRNTSAGTTAGTAVQTDSTVGNIWKVAATTTAANSIDIASGNLTGPSELKGSIGNSLTILDGTNSGAADRLAFRTDTTAGSNITSGTIYYSFLLNVSSLTGANNVAGDYFISLNNTANLATANNPTVVPGQVRLRIDPTDGTKLSMGMFTNRTPTSADTAWVNGLSVGTTHFIVGAYNVGSTNSTRLWIDPDPLTFGLASAPVTDTAHDNTSAANGNTIGSLLLHQRNVVPDLTLDELRVGTLWSEVTPLGNPTLYWDIDALGTTAGAGGATPSGTWDASNTNWNNGANGDVGKLAWTSGGAATFSAGGDATGAYTVTVSGTQSASQVTFEDGTATLSGGTLSLTGSLHTISVNSGKTANIDSVVGGSVGFIKDGAGTLVLTANETYSGTTTINGGTLQLGNGGTTGTLPTGSAITDNGTFTVNRTNAVTQGTDFSGSAIGGTGGLTQAGSSTLTLNAANSFSGTTRAGAGTLLLTNSLAVQNSIVDMNGSDTGALSFDSSLTAVTIGGLTGSRNLSLLNAAGAGLAVTTGSGNGSPAAPYTGVLSGGSSLTKTGTGTQVLSGANTYTGGTTINGGTLQFAKTFAMPVASSADYNGDGNVDGADYVLWRKNPGAHGGDPAGYNNWRANYGLQGTGNVLANSGGTLAVNAGGTDEWTDSTVETTNGTIGSLIKGLGGQAGTTVKWMSGGTLAIDTTNAPGAPTAPDLTYNGVIGAFRTTGGGTTDAVGFTKRGTGTLTLNGINTFSGQLTVAGGVNSATTSTLVLNGTNLNAGTTMTIPTVSIGTFSTLQLGASNILPAGSLINTTGGQAKLHLNDAVAQTVRSISGNNGIIEVGLGKLTINDQAGDNYVYGIPGGAYIMSSDGIFDPNKGIVDKIGAGTLTLEGDAGNNFNGTFIMENGTLKLSRNQALGNTGGSGRLVVKGGQLARSDTPIGNFTYSLSNLDLFVFRYDLSDDAARTSQWNASTITTLKQNDVEMNITNSGTQTAASGRFNFLGEIRNHDPNPLAGDDSNAIRGITKTGNGVLFLQATTAYKGSTTVQDGVLLVNAASTLGDYTQATIGTLYLKGGIMATTATRTTPIKNPVAVDGSGTIAHFSTTNSLSSVVMEFDNNSIVGTSGSLTISNLNAGTGNTVFRPLFTGNGFNFGLPITISSSTGTGSNIKSNELEGGNTSGTQTFSGVISGGGSFRRVNSGGTTNLSGNNTYTGNTSVDAGTLSITNPYLADTADVLLTTGAIFDLSFVGTDVIDQLFFDAASQATGTWGAIGSGATNENAFFTGTGLLQVSNPGSGSGSGLGAGAVPEPGTLSLVILAAGSALIGIRRRKS